MNPSTNKNKKNIIRVVVVAGIVLAIGYIEVNKPVNTAPSGANTSLAVAPASSTDSVSSAMRIAAKAKKYTTGKELAGIQGYINSPAILANGAASTTAPFNLSDLVGKKVILIDFWTYSCINCLRTTPYLTAWDQKYKDAGLVIVGVHTPEFDFEKDYSNVAAAVQRLGIQYPVVLDSNQGTWNAYHNMYWPHEFLIDIDGFVVHDHIGEGGYAETEQAIQTALKERAQVLGVTTTVNSGITAPTDAVSMNPSKVQSPETYFGAARNEYLGNGRFGLNGAQTLTLPASPSPNTLYLGGTWKFSDQYAENSNPGASILFNYNAKNVYFVAAATSSSSRQANSVRVKVFIDGQMISKRQAGTDVGVDGSVLIQSNRLYNLVKDVDYAAHTLRLEIEDAGLDAFTFTFG